MDNKKHLMVIKKKEPLGKWEQALVSEMTWDEAIQAATKFLSPAIMPTGNGTAVQVKITEFGKQDWTYIPQWLS